MARIHDLPQEMIDWIYFYVDEDRPRVVNRTRDAAPPALARVNRYFREQTLSRFFGAATFVVKAVTPGDVVVFRDWAHMMGPGNLSRVRALELVALAYVTDGAWELHCRIEFRFFGGHFTTNTRWDNYWVEPPTGFNSPNALVRLLLQMGQPVHINVIRQEFVAAADNFPQGLDWLLWARWAGRLDFPTAMELVALVGVFQQFTESSVFVRVLLPGQNIPAILPRQIAFRLGIMRYIC